MAEFEVKGETYRTLPMDARSQFHVARRLGMILKEVPTIMESGSAQSAIAPLMAALGTLPDAELDYVLNACLSFIQRRDGDSWNLVITRSGAIMYDDVKMSLPILMSLVAPVIQEHIQGFLSDLPSTSLGSLVGKPSS